MGTVSGSTRPHFSLTILSITVPTLDIGVSGYVDEV
jgi:hypothetical protein